jgi:hypothetical protein
MYKIMTHNCGELLNLKEPGPTGKGVFIKYKTLYLFVQNCTKAVNKDADDKNIRVGLRQFFKNCQTKPGGTKNIRKNGK